MILTVKPKAREDLVALELATLADLANITSYLLRLNDLRNALETFLFLMDSPSI
jgi:hypothetical protein